MVRRGGKFRGHYFLKLLKVDITQSSTTSCHGSLYDVSELGQPTPHPDYSYHVVLANPTAEGFRSGSTKNKGESNLSSSLPYILGRCRDNFAGLRRSATV